MEVELRGISKSFGTVRALQSIDWKLRGGELALVTGPNGSGKSTLLKILSTALVQDEGQYAWEGQPVRHILQSVRSRIGYLGEQPGLYEDLTVEQNLLFWGQLYSLHAQPLPHLTSPNGFRLWLQPLLRRPLRGTRLGRKGEEINGNPVRTREILAIWNLGTYATRPVRTLSQGMLRRLGLSRIMNQNPSLILLDEPFNGLDGENSATLIRTISEWKSAGKIIVIATHQPEIVEQMADHHLLLLEGHVDGVEGHCFRSRFRDFSK